MTTREINKNGTRNVIKRITHQGADSGLFAGLGRGVGRGWFGGDGGWGGGGGGKETLRARDLHFDKFSRKPYVKFGRQILFI